MAAQKTQSLPPIWERSSVKPLKLHVHLNGEQYLEAKDVTLNKKVTSNFEKWLDSMTRLLQPRDGALRCAFTPQNGHRVRSLDALKDGDRVVLGCREAFQRLSYETIQAPRRGGHHTSKRDLWTGQNSRYQVSAQYKKVDTHGTRILCWQNNSKLFAARPVVLPPLGSPQLTMAVVIDRVNEKMCKTSGRFVNRLFTLDGKEITTVDQLQPHGCYVAVCEYECFKKTDYPEKSAPHFSTSPRPERRLLPPISRSTKTSSQSTPEHSLSSNNGSERSYTQRYRRERAKKEEDGPFHVRPVKHKRSSEKVRQTDYDKDNGGVFKAKSQNRATKGAREVQDSRHTKTEVPVDQRPTEEVQEDVKGKGKKDKTGKKQQHEQEQETPPFPAHFQNHQQKQQQQQQQQGDRANAKRSQDPAGSQRAAERDARARREAEDRQRVEKHQQQQEQERERRRQRQREEEEEEERRRQRQREEEEEEERRQEEARRRREEVEEERRRMEEQERQWREQEEQRKAAQDHSRPDEQEGRARESPYRSGTDILRDEQQRGDWDRTPTPQKEPGPGGQADDQGAWEDDSGAGTEEEERVRAATTIQAYYRGMKTRQEVRAMRAMREG